MLASAAAAAVAATTAAGILAWTPGWTGQRFSDPAAELLRRLAEVILAGLLPVEPNARQQATAQHLQRLSGVVASLPGATQSELSDLLALLSMPPGRWAMAGLAGSWTDASHEDIAKALQTMRHSAMAPRQQVYQALRELTIAAHFSDSASWGTLGYPGPQPL